MRAALRAAIPVAMLSLCACVRHVRPYTPKQRTYELPVQPRPADPGALDPDLAASGASAFTPDAVALTYFQDSRAARVNDQVVVLIDERSSAQRDASTTTGRSAKYSADIQKFLGLVKALKVDHPDLQEEGFLEALTESDFEGTGKTSRNDRVTATVPAMVRKVFANGSMFIEGHRVVLVNNEENHFYISGLIRPVDIDMDNRVRSNVIADAEVELTGRGDVSNATQRGWLAGVVDFVWPF